MNDLLVPSRYCGPPSSGNGGWSAGALSVHAGGECPDDHARPWPTIEVSLRRPPPLETPMSIAAADGGVAALHEDDVVATARCTHEDLVDVEPVPPDEARAATAAYAGLVSHPFPTCFACGTGRAEGDGLRIFPGRVADHDGAVRVAATWTPDASVAEDYHSYADEHPRASVPVTWAALDCVGGWAGDLEERLMVLARMTTRLDSLPVIGEEHVIVGSGGRSKGRKTWTSSSLYDADGRVVGTAEHLWVAVDPAAFA
ncbi:hypothetical protein [Nocardioides cynanchi]|uniref:hypothetical protein n=1 Tax=Nocardioides cynanchi TaxID=2558918 RepID=UPI0012460B25|nr:hypothetical protein [Nocardioides cynanchi]